VKIFTLLYVDLYFYSAHPDDKITCFCDTCPWTRYRYYYLRKNVHCYPDRGYQNFAKNRHKLHILTLTHRSSSSNWLHTVAGLIHGSGHRSSVAGSPNAKHRLRLMQKHTRTRLVTLVTHTGDRGNTATIAAPNSADCDIVAYRPTMYRTLNFTH